MTLNTDQNFVKTVIWESFIYLQGLSVVSKDLEHHSTLVLSVKKKDDIFKVVCQC